MKSKRRAEILIPILAAALFSALNLFGFFKTVENRFYDILLHLKPAVAEDPSILLLDVDDTAIANVGVWPWSRDIMAEGLLTMREFGAEYAVFDIEYTEQSPRGVDSALLNEKIPRALAGEFSMLNRNIQDLFAAVRAKTLSIADAAEYLKDLESLSDRSREKLLAAVRSIVRDNDDFLGRAAGVFGKAYFTVNMLPSGEEKLPPELRALGEEKLPLEKAAADPGAIPYRTVEIRPAIYPILSRAAGAGFPNVEVDGDGVRRRLFLALDYKGRVYPQLAFSALHDKLGRPRVTVKKDRIILEGAALPGKGTKDLTVPLARDGTVLINWPAKNYWNSFRHLSYWHLELHRRQEDALARGLELMEQDQYLSYHEKNPHFLDLYRRSREVREALLAGEASADFREYAALREEFFREAADFLDGPAEGRILSIIDNILKTGRPTEDEKREYGKIRGEVETNFRNLRSLDREFRTNRETLARNLKGAFCIIGNTATSTTDLGVNPFAERYENVGTHASIANTILQEKFLDDAPLAVRIIMAFLLTTGTFFLLRRLEPLASILAGMAVVAVVLAGGAVFFVATGVYPGLLTPTLAVFFTFVSLAFLKFLVTAREKSYIRNAFGHYLAADVINELLVDPDKLRLGGEKKHMTAIFTDVRGFSTISEQMDPTDLVRLLNLYLTRMSDTIMDLRGTIDKYEGDAIIAFFGAPVSYPEHAANALESAVRMKKIEAELNEQFLRDKLSPLPLLTRIGINTGDMVVGNMGTAKKMDYTIMGNAVNLAARLEGVNKQYGTWVLASEFSYGEVGDRFTARMLDRVRVVGINTPVRLHEVLDMKSETPADLREGVDVFHSGLDLFEKKDWAKAKKMFAETLRILPDDGPATVFLKRCDANIQNPPPESWDGVFNLTTK